ncbi:hypothetical protein N7462_000267 [Penicillium macrosclerotiorum]|uniref:uncharacterized protein n=1 Tax=Penicillium macrosclerotiorum TaxID=303699 RepID=UPI00254683F2|nr:uncharacterized protein N7462_000267 [Penicillium macrosclerotiorum]KAJ5698262.1 hypothetical protein N7462_000267 [Penicillium macrosclerotiorum]
MDYALPVIVVFHGAGLQANSPQAREMLDAAYGVCAWMLFPSGVTSWSGDDWHYWGIADLQAALLAIPDWIANVDWRGPTSSQEDLIVVGHSNGGQGAWYFSTHFPDKVSGVAPVAAYTSIENYVPYTMWQFSDPSLSSVLSRSRSSYRHELLLSNLAGIPIAQQHGSCDNNVPVYHARLMHELLDQIQWPSMYQELPGKPHWFEGVMTTQYLRDFYHVMINKTRKTLEDQLPETFTITIPASGDLGSKAKIQVDQLQSPDTNGKLKVSRASGTHTWYITTWNIYRFHLSSEGPRIELPLFIVLDNTQIAFDVDPSQLLETWYLKDANGQWSVSHDSHWRTLDQRYGRQLGAMDAILHTRGPFTIRMCSPGIEHAALQVSRNLLQYFAADSQIVEGCLDDWERSQPGSNTITLAMGQDLPPALLDSYPIRIERDRLVIWKNHSVLARSVRRHEFSWEAGLGAVFLRPREDEALELVIWGADLAGLSQSLRLAPTITGSGQPDYVVLSDHCRWQGIAGVYAAGHLDRSWQVSPASYHSQPI